MISHIIFPHVLKRYVQVDFNCVTRPVYIIPVLKHLRLWNICSIYGFFSKKKKKKVYVVVLRFQILYILVHLIDQVTECASLLLLYCYYF